MRGKAPVWFFDLDNTLHDASHAAFGATNRAMTEYIVDHLDMDFDAASALRQHYWHHYGATLLGLVRHHGVRPAHFLEQTHRLPELESKLRMSAHDRAVLRRLPGRKFILTNAPRAYTLRVMGGLRLLGAFDAPVRKRPKPGERRMQILQTLAAMLEQPGAERITTAALAARLEVSEAALYRHFASKAQMFEGLIEFIESSVFTLVNQIAERESDGCVQARASSPCCCSSARRTRA
jgi:pyrimidine 5'-nucleotidase